MNAIQQLAMLADRVKAAAAEGDWLKARDAFDKLELRFEMEAERLRGDVRTMQRLVNEIGLQMVGQRPLLTAINVDTLKRLLSQSPGP